MISILRNWWHRRIVQKSEITDTQWELIFSSLPILNRLTLNEKEKLRQLAIIFLYQKDFVGAQGLTITESMKNIIALQACLPILNLGMDWYRKWSSIIIYPGDFVPGRAHVDENGIVHQNRDVLSGEAWLRGPVILSWNGVVSATKLDGTNLVIHEFVHKLDMINGVANGFPPLHKNMDKSHWSNNFQHAYEDLNHRINMGKKTVIDNYAASEPAEFFAVLSEVFFERPEQLEAIYPVIYKHLVDFFRQNPLERL